MALISTKSPIVLRPSLMPETHMIITAVSPTVKIAACPALSTASDV